MNYNKRKKTQTINTINVIRIQTTTFLIIRPSHVIQILFDFNNNIKLTFNFIFYNMNLNTFFHLFNSNNTVYEKNTQMIKQKFGPMNLQLSSIMALIC